MANVVLVKTPFRLLVPALVALALLLSVWWGWPFFHDDAYITLRYVDRLLHGKGLTWTSVGPPVEGFTHPLWALQLLALGGLGVDLEWAARLLGLAYLVGLAVLWYARGWWPLPLVALVTSPAVALWAGGGLETVSFAFWCVVCGAFAARPREPMAAGTAAAWGAALAACALTRPEGLGVAALAILVSGQRAASRRALAPVVATLGGLVGAYLGFRLLYYHDWLPNTAYAKIGTLSLAERLSSCVAQLAATPALWLPALLAVLLALASPEDDESRDRRHAVWRAALLSTPILASWILAGGDHMPGLRPLVPVLALFAAGLAWRAPRRLAPVVGVALWIAWNVLTLARDAPAVQRDPAAWNGEVAGRLLAAHLPAGSVVAVATAGSTPYYAPALEFIDTLGLNDRHIARRRDVPVRTRGQRLYPGHGKGDGAYVLSLRPDVIVLGPAEGFLGTPPDAWFLSDLELALSPAFHEEYSPYGFAAPPAPLTAGWTMGRRPRPGFLPVVLYLRNDSPRVAGLRATGQPL